MRIAARAMRSVMVDRARKRLAKKRGGRAEVVRIDDLEVGSDEPTAQLVALEEALSRLEERDERLAHVVQLRYFAGQSVEETAATLGVSARTVKRDWRLARAFLHAELADESTRRDEVKR
jgi:RNA polymerase sigma factor (TIGR02999 family)